MLSVHHSVISFFLSITAHSHISHTISHATVPLGCWNFSNVAVLLVRLAMSRRKERRRRKRKRRKERRGRNGRQMKTAGKQRVKAAKKLMRVRRDQTRRLECRDAL